MLKFEEIKGTGYRVGDRIKCWNDKDTTRTMMQLAANGILADEDVNEKNLLIIKKINEV